MNLQNQKGLSPQLSFVPRAGPAAYRSLTSVRVPSPQSETELAAATALQISGSTP